MGIKKEKTREHRQTMDINEVKQMESVQKILQHLRKRSIKT